MSIMDIISSDIQKRISEKINNRKKDDPPLKVEIVLTEVDGNQVIELIMKEDDN